MDNLSGSFIFVAVSWMPRSPSLGCDDAWLVAEVTGQ